jgi:dihydroorotate dehydrogenase (fumarate)
MAMVDLSVQWLGLDLRSPLVVGASPLCDTASDARELVSAGAGAIVLRSLFEEQLVSDQLAAHRFFDAHVDMNAEARSFLPDTDVFSVATTPTTDRIRALKDTVDVPVIASLNGVTPGGWVHHALELADAGADAIELNLYDVVTDLAETGEQVERRQLEVVASVVAEVDVPVSVKLSAQYTSVPSFVGRVESAGAAGVVVFNRFHQPDIDLDTLDVDRHLALSTSSELPLRLHALAVLHHRTGLSLAAVGGVHHGTDAAKAVLCGAHVVQVVSAVLVGGPGALARIHRELADWLDEHGYAALREARGATALDNVADPHAWERLNYTQLLASWRPSRRP